jgi:large subunit ribosomal protein L10
MAVTLQDKQSVVEALTADIQAASGVYLINYQGLKVELDNAFRKELNKKGIRYVVSKNTLIKRALANAGVTGLDKYLEGVSAVMLGQSDDPITPAKEIVAFLTENKNAITVKGVNIEGDVIDGAKIVDISKMPGRLELIGQIVSIAMGPGANLVAILKGPGSNVAGAVKSIADKE